MFRMKIIQESLFLPYNEQIHLSDISCGFSPAMWPFCLKNMWNMCDRAVGKNFVYVMVPLNNCLSPQRGKQLFIHSMG